MKLSVVETVYLAAQPHPYIILIQTLQQEGPMPPLCRGHIVILLLLHSSATPIPYSARKIVRQDVLRPVRQQLQRGREAIDLQGGIPVVEDAGVVDLQLSAPAWK